MTIEVAPTPPADDEPTTPPGYTAEYEAPTVTIVGDEPPPSMHTPPPPGSTTQPEMFSIATPGDSPDHADDDDGDEEGDADSLNNLLMRIS